MDERSEIVETLELLYDLIGERETENLWLNYEPMDVMES